MPISFLMKKSLILLLSLFLSGCIGWGVWQPLSDKPYTYISKGSQFGRDQIANRSLVARAKVVLKGRDANEVLTLLGQPQQIQVLERGISEDWYFTYYKYYVAYNPTNKVGVPDSEGEFVVRMYRGEVIAVETLK